MGQGRNEARPRRMVLSALVTLALALGTGVVTASAKDVDLDPSSRASVARAYNKVLAPALRVKTGWNGSVASCRVGKESAKSRKATRKAINFVRALNRLDPVKLSSKLNKRALRAALLMQANGALSHSPTKASFSRCYSSAARTAAGRSNLFLAYYGSGDRMPSTGARAIVGYMTDPGSGNEAVGHRRWILNPSTRVMATGSTRHANALTVTGTKRSSKAASPTYLTWPSKGWFPTQLEPEGRWSISTSRSRVSFARAKVKVHQVSSKGKKLRSLKVKKHKIKNGYGPHTLVFTVKGVKVPQGKKSVRYRVSVSGIKGAKKSKYSYTVKIFDPTRF